MSVTLTELHRSRSRLGIALAVAGTAILIIGIYFFFQWWDLKAVVASQNVYVPDAWDYGVFATIAFIIGIPILSLGLGQVWLASRRNALIEGAMIEKFIGSEREMAAKSPVQ
jgi:hypothetical protein